MAGTLLTPRLSASGRLAVNPRGRVGELLYNGGLEFVPPFTAAANIGLRWINGTASGSTTDSRYGWYVFDVSASGANVRFDPSEFYSGTHSMKLSLTDSASRLVQVWNESSPASLYRMRSVLPNTSYTLRYRLKTNRTSGDGTGAFATFSQRTGTGAFVSDTNGTGIRTTTGWTEYSIQLTTSATTRFMLVKLQLLGTGGTANLIMDAWFDDISLMPDDNSLARTNLL